MTVGAAFVVVVVVVLAYLVFGRGGGGGAVPGPAASAGPKVIQRLTIRAAVYGLPAPVQREVAVAANGRVYLAGGLDAQQASAAGVFSLNPSSGRLTQLGSVPQPFHDAAGALIGHTLFVFGGGQATSSASVQAFDLRRRSGAVVGTLPVALSDLGAAAVGSTVYLVGGWDGHTPQRAIYATTNGQSFKHVADLPEGLRYPAVVSVGGMVLVAGGQSASGPVDGVWAFDPATGKVSEVGRLPAPLAHAAAVSVGGSAYVVGGQSSSGVVRTVTRLTPDAGGRVAVAAAAPLASPVADAGAASDGTSGWLVGGRRGSGTVGQVLHVFVRRIVIRPSPSASPSPSGSPMSAAALAAVRPFAGLLIIADRGNNRLLVVNAQKQIVWRYPSPNLPAPPYRFYFPDDSFWVHGGHAILINEEENNTLIEIAYPSGQVIWTYGHPGVAGSARGYLHQPDDAYPLPNGGVTVADALNCRILFFGPRGHPSGQFGQNGNCTPNMPTTVGYPNGDKPLANGDFLISQINGSQVTEVRPDGSVVWSVHVPGVSYPSDPQPLPNGSGYLVADFAKPGRLVEFTSTGRVLWSYGPKSGPGMLDHPSLAAPLPNGLIAVNDDYNDRVMLIDPATKKIVWQYGVKGHPGKAHGFLNTPDGLDLLLPNGDIPLHLDFPSATVHRGRP